MHVARFAVGVKDLSEELKAAHIAGLNHKPHFSLQEKDAITQNMLVMCMVKNGAVTFAYP